MSQVEKECNEMDWTLSSAKSLGGFDGRSRGAYDINKTSSNSTAQILGGSSTISRLLMNPER